MIELPEIAIYSDGCRLCEQALAVMRSAAGPQADHVVEKPISNVSPNETAELGISSTPSIVFNEMVAAVGIPSAEEAARLIKRAQLDRGIQRYAIPKSKAMQNFAEGKIPTEATARALASEFYPFSEEFPLFLSAAISHIRDDTARFLLVHNLYEEHGNLSSPDRLHPALFRAFCRGVGMEVTKLEEQDANAPGVQAAKMVMEICRQGPADRAIAALYPIELMFGPTCDTIIRGLRHLHLSPDALDYWFIHSSSGVEQEHAEQMRQALFRACKTEEQWERAVGVSEDVAQMFFELFDHIARASMMTTEEQLAVFDEVKRICADSPKIAEHPLNHSSATYYMAMNLGGHRHWFLRALGDSERRSLVSRFSVDHARHLAPGFQVEPAPRVFGRSRVFYNGVDQLRELKKFILACYEEEMKHVGTTHGDHARP